MLSKSKSKDLLKKNTRRFEVLRLSVIKECNFRCTYCTTSTAPSKSFPYLDYANIVTSLNRVLRGGLKSVRLTGGEPTLYKGLLALISELKKIVPKVSLTTNGFLLPKMAKGLKSAGLDSLNVSFDALDEALFERITKTRLQDKVKRGIDDALAVGLNIKINTVVMKGINDGEILPLLDYFGDRGIIIRFLELMNMGHLYHSQKDYFFSEGNILESIGQSYNIYPKERIRSSTSRYWRTGDNKEFGIISNTSSPFCFDCNRLRVDHGGYLYGCLSSDRGFYLGDVLGDDEALRSLLDKALLDKQDSFKGSLLSMQTIGG